MDSIVGVVDGLIDGLDEDVCSSTYLVGDGAPIFVSFSIPPPSKETKSAQ